MDGGGGVCWCGVLSQEEVTGYLADIALRASHLDEEGIDAIAQMIDYVLKRNPK